MFKTNVRGSDIWKVHINCNIKNESQLSKGVSCDDPAGPVQLLEIHSHLWLIKPSSSRVALESFKWSARHGVLTHGQLAEGVSP